MERFTTVTFIPCVQGLGVEQAIVGHLLSPKGDSLHLEDCSPFRQMRTEKTTSDARASGAGKHGEPLGWVTAADRAAHATGHDYQPAGKGLQ